MVKKWFFRFCPWNIHGINDDKICDSLFNKYLDKYDIIFLQETWLQSDLSIDGFYTFSSIRHKTHKKGRAASGISLITKEKNRKGIKILQSTEFFIAVKLAAKFFKLDNDTIIFNVYYLTAKFFKLENDSIIFNVYLPPEGSTIYEATNYNVFEQLHDIINKYQEYDPIICGDFNARTGVENDYFLNDNLHKYMNSNYSHFDNSAYLKRNNSDNCTNKFGKSLLNLCRELQLKIVNGRYTSA